MNYTEEEYAALMAKLGQNKAPAKPAIASKVIPPPQAEKPPHKPPQGADDVSSVSFTVYGAPVAKGRPRLGKFGTYTPQKTVEYENLVKLSYLQQCGNVKLDGALSAVIKAFFPIPKSTSKRMYAFMLDGTERHTKKPDADNIAKAILDSLNGIAYDDDSAVVELICEKWYSDTPRTEVTITRK